MTSATKCPSCGVIYDSKQKHFCGKRKLQEAVQWTKCTTCGTSHPRGVIHTC